MAHPEINQTHLVNILLSFPALRDNDDVWQGGPNELEYPVRVDVPFPFHQVNISPPVLSYYLGDAEAASDAPGTVVQVSARNWFGRDRVITYGNTHQQRYRMKQLDVLGATVPGDVNSATISSLAVSAPRRFIFPLSTPQTLQGTVVFFLGRPGVMPGLFRTFIPVSDLTVVFDMEFVQYREEKPVSALAPAPATQSEKAKKRQRSSK